MFGEKTVTDDHPDFLMIAGFLGDQAIGPQAVTFRRSLLAEFGIDTCSFAGSIACCRKREAGLGGAAARG